MEKFGIKNHITIPGFAVVELRLSGNELVCFSLIYGFCQDGESEFYGSLTYVTSALNIDRRNVIEVIKRLVQKGLIIKRIEEVNRVKKCYYSIPTEMVAKNHHQCRNNTRGSDETAPKVVMKQHRGSDETAPNNIIYKDNDTITDSTPADDPLHARWIKFQKWISANCPEVQKMKYPITEDQFRTLITKYSNEAIIAVLQEMNNWTPLRKRNTSAYQTLINWIRRDEQRTRKTTTGGTAGNRADATLGTNFRPSDI